MPLITPQNSPWAAAYDQYGDKLFAAQCDTDEGWIELLIMHPNGKKVIVERKSQEVLKVKVHMNYQIRDSKTQELMYEVKWPYNSKLNGNFSSYCEEAEHFDVK